MADAIGPSTGSTTGVEAGTSGGQTSLDQAIQTAVSKAMLEMQAQINSLSENISKLANTASNTTASDVDSETIARSSIDPADNQRIVNYYKHLSMERAASFAKAVDLLTLRKISQDTDHHGAIPPIAPRSASGPGTTAS